MQMDNSFRYNQATSSWEQFTDDNSHLPTYNTESEEWESSGNPPINVNFGVAVPVHRVFSPMLLVHVPVPMPEVPVSSWTPYVPASLVLPPPQYIYRLATQGSSGEPERKRARRCEGGDKEGLPGSYGAGVITPMNHSGCASVIQISSTSLSNYVNLTIPTNALSSRKR